jgi:hypothetical protein
MSSSVSSGRNNLSATASLLFYPCEIKYMYIQSRPTNALKPENVSCVMQKILQMGYPWSIFISWEIDILSCRSYSKPFTACHHKCSTSTSVLSTKEQLLLSPLGKVHVALLSLKPQKNLVSTRMIKILCHRRWKLPEGNTLFWSENQSSVVDMQYTCEVKSVLMSHKVGIAAH